MAFRFVQIAFAVNFIASCLTTHLPPPLSVTRIEMTLVIKHLFYIPPVLVSARQDRFKSFVFHGYSATFESVRFWKRSEN